MERNGIPRRALLAVALVLGLGCATTVHAADDAASADTVGSVAQPAAAAPDSAPRALNAQPGAVRKVRLVGGDHNVLRAGPGESYAIVGVYPDKSEFPVLAKRGAWYGVGLTDTETG